MCVTAITPIGIQKRVGIKNISTPIGIRWWAVGVFSVRRVRIHSLFNCFTVFNKLVLAGYDCSWEEKSRRLSTFVSCLYRYLSMIYLIALLAQFLTRVYIGMIIYFSVAAYRRPIVCFHTMLTIVSAI